VTPIDPVATLILDKKALGVTDPNGDGNLDKGEAIQFGFTVTNTGNVTVADIKVDDAMLAGLGITITCPVTTLAPSESTTCLADQQYVVTAKDEAVGFVINTAAVDGVDPTGKRVVSNPDTVKIPSAADQQDPTDPTDPVGPQGPNVPFLPTTGGPALAILLGGLALIAGGALLIVAGRRRRDDDDEGDTVHA
jgi:uncharacterized repeat protein (TIGR01451 family)/LPXTG-motif cell wall-anchored protein